MLCLLALVDGIEKLILSNLTLALLFTEGLLGLKELLIQNLIKSTLFLELLLQLMSRVIGLLRALLVD